jgi:hypothetical protein
MIPMKYFHNMTVIALLLGFSLVGCSCKRQTIPDGAFETGTTRHQKEDFDRSLELINRLDDSPCLPNTPGYEKLVSIADRLNIWIQNQKPDETWKPDTALQEIEKTVMNVADTATKIVRSLALLQGEVVVDETTGQQIIASESLQAERQAVVRDLEELVTQTKTLATLADLSSLLLFSQQAFALQQQFTALDSIPNLTAAHIRAFAKSLENQTIGFAVSAEMLKLYAQQLKTDGLFITTSDVEYLKQSAWMRDLADWTCGDKSVLLNQIVQMCDWVVCNIEMRNNRIPINQTQEISVMQQYPWQTILLGYGIAQDRKTVFMELLRQRRIDSALLAVPNPNNPNEPLYWAVGVLLDGEVYPFQLTFGYPFPGPEGVKVGNDGSLQFSSIATLSQLMEDDSLLRQFDVSPERKFPITAEMLKQTTAHLFVIPESVSMRMKVLESELSGEQNMVLYTDTHELRRRFLSASGITGVEFWKYPFRTAFEQQFNPEPTHEALRQFFMVNRPRLNLDDSAAQKHFPLWSGRVLYFRGEISGQDKAITKYQNARISDKEMIGFRNDPVFRNSLELNALYQWFTVQASYWLGTALFEIDSIEAAKENLMGIRTNRMNMWQHHTEYILGRIAEREKRYDDARQHYGNTVQSLSGDGNAIRARWLP